MHDQLDVCKFLDPCQERRSQPRGLECAGAGEVEGEESRFATDFNGAGTVAGARLVSAVARELHPTWHRRTLQR
jgi:hypothetical protein